MLGRAPVAVVALLALAGCGGGSAGLAAESAAALHQQVSAVRAAADTDDRAAADAAVGAFRAEVRRLTDAGQLTAAEAMSLLAQADAIASRVDTEVTPTPTATPTADPVTADPTAAGPAGPQEIRTADPEEIRAAQQEAADRLTALLRERIADYIKAKQKAAKDAEKGKGGGRGPGKDSIKAAADGKRAHQGSK